MKKHYILIIGLILILAACSNSTDNLANTDSNQGGNGQIIQSGSTNSGGPADSGSAPLSTSGPDCYADGEHPIAASIAEQYEEITNYDEVMTWFCNGAYFEDILNALMTEEMVDANADELLHMLADGKTWNDIWLELGITEE